jgi:hypothetical protein
MNRNTPEKNTVGPTAWALTAKEMNSPYKKTSEGGLVVWLVFC